MFRESSAAAHIAPSSEGIVVQLKQRQQLFIEPEWWKDELPDTKIGNIRRILRAFVQGTMKGAMGGAYPTHVFTAHKNGTELWLKKNNKSIQASLCIARNLNGFFVGNSSSFDFIRVVKTGEIKPTHGGRHKFQEIMGEIFPMVPFGVFQDAKLDLDTMSLIEKGPDEQLDVGRVVDGRKVLTHFTGAMVFSIKSSRGEDAFYLFDIDRNDLKLKNLNFFLSRLARPVTGIADAYASLKPQEVYDAERFLGKPCERQGEWFFIPVQGNFTPRRQPGHPLKHQEAVLQSKGNRAHYVSKLSEEGYVKGRVSHGGHEHKPIELEGWCKPVPNTAVESFKISGAVD